jgi:endonuclease-3
MQALEALYGRPPAPPSDPFELILREQVAYLADDETRDRAFRLLERSVGVDPKAIAAAEPEVLLAVTRSGGAIAPDARADRLRAAATLALEKWDGDLRRVLKLPFVEARRELERFPAIGEPGAEKILLFAGAHPVLALDSNGLRVLLRLGYGKESKSYSTTYRSAQRPASEELPKSCDRLADAFQLLRRHGQRLCTRARPACGRCPAAALCDYAAGRRRA